jgi:hypothetical protein
VIGILPVSGVRGGKNTGCATRHFNMGRTAGMPELGKHDAAPHMHGIGNSSPASDLLLRVQSRGTEPIATGQGRY